VHEFIVGKRRRVHLIKARHCYQQETPYEFKFMFGDVLLNGTRGNKKFTFTLTEIFPYDFFEKSDMYMK
jgi:hypothetical protein